MTALTTIRGFFAIPANTHPSYCDYCDGTIYWIEHRCKPKRKGELGKLSRLPISVKHDAAIAPTSTTWGQGPSHFSDCPNVARYLPGTGKRGSPPL